MSGKRTFTLLDFGLVALAAVIAVQMLLARRAPAFPPVHLELAETRLEIRAAKPDDPDQRAALQRWIADAAHYGAFATSPDGAWGWTDRYNDAAMAEASALAFCARRGTGCAVIAVSVPETPAPEGHVTMRRENVVDFLDYRDLPGARAFAVAESGASGWAWDYRSRAEAEAAALANCASRNAERADDLPQTTCRVIDSAGALSELLALLR